MKNKKVAQFSHSSLHSLFLCHRHAKTKHYKKVCFRQLFLHSWSFSFNREDQYPRKWVFCYRLCFYFFCFLHTKQKLMNLTPTQQQQLPFPVVVVVMRENSLEDVTGFVANGSMTLRILSMILLLVPL